MVIFVFFLSFIFIWVIICEKIEACPHLRPSTGVVHIFVSTLTLFIFVFVLVFVFIFVSVFAFAFVGRLQPAGGGTVVPLVSRFDTGLAACHATFHGSLSKL